MLSDEQIDHYRTFGFLVLPGRLDEHETAALGAELDRAHRDAFGARYDERPDRGGIDGHYLPMMSRTRTPRSLALVEDPRFLAAARQLIGAAVVPFYAEGILYFGEAGFHDDAGPGVKAVKFVAYLEPLTADTGALRLLPGSHHRSSRPSWPPGTGGTRRWTPSSSAARSRGYRCTWPRPGRAT
jgi:hypothetical protein